MYLTIPKTEHHVIDYSVGYYTIYVAYDTIKAFLCYVLGVRVKYFVVRLISREYERIFVP